MQGWSQHNRDSRDAADYRSIESVKKRCCGLENRMLDMLTPCSEDIQVYRNAIKHAAKQPFRISYGEQNQTKQPGKKKKEKKQQRSNCRPV